MEYSEQIAQIARIKAQKLQARQQAAQARLVVLKDFVEFAQALKKANVLDDFEFPGRDADNPALYLLPTKEENDRILVACGVAAAREEPLHIVIKAAGFKDKHFEPDPRFHHDIMDHLCELIGTIQARRALLEPETR